MHDRHGNPLRVGDTVILVATITELSPHEDFCNVSIRSLFGRRPDGVLETVQAINTAVLEKADVQTYGAGPCQAGGAYSPAAGDYAGGAHT